MVVIVCTKRRDLVYLDLPLHGDAEECYEVHDEYWPEDRHVEKLEEGAEEGDDGGLGGGRGGSAACDCAGDDADIYGCK